MFHGSQIWSTIYTNFNNLKMLESIGEEETFKLMEKDLANLMENKIFRLH